MKSVVIRKLQSSDYQSLAIFNSRFPGDTRNDMEWLARFKYWWDENPAYDESWIRGFVLVSSDRIVGFVGSFPTFFKAGDEIVKAFNGTTWRVSEDFRKYSIDLWEKNREISKDYFSFNTTPTPDVSKLITLMGYERYGFVNDKASFLIGNDEFLAQFFSGRLPVIIKNIGSCILRLWQFRLNLLSSDDLKVKLEPMNHDDLVDLWTRTKDQFSHTNVRNHEAVEWYSRNKRIKYVYLGDTLIAYGIYLLTYPNQRIGCYATLVDFWYDFKFKLSIIINALIKSDISLLNQDNSLSTIRYPHYTQDFARIMIRIGMLKYRYHSTSYFRRANRKKPFSISSSSYYTLLQGDFGT